MVSSSESSGDERPTQRRLTNTSEKKCRLDKAHVIKYRNWYWGLAGVATLILAAKTLPFVPSINIPGFLEGLFVLSMSACCCLALCGYRQHVQQILRMQATARPSSRVEDVTNLEFNTAITVAPPRTRKSKKSKKNKKQTKAYMPPNPVYEEDTHLLTRSSSEEDLDSCITRVASNAIHQTASRMPPVVLHVSPAAEDPSPVAPKRSSTIFQAPITTTTSWGQMPPSAYQSDGI